jgi:hypothetical protein
LCITIGGMRRVLACTATAIVALAGAGIGATRGDTRPPPVASRVYDAHLWVPARVDADLARRPAPARRLYVSVEANVDSSATAWWWSRASWPYWKGDLARGRIERRRIAGMRAGGAPSA